MTFAIPIPIVLGRTRTIREHVVEEARSWIPTPYKKMAHVKHAGADCFTFIAEVMIACMLMTREQLPQYGYDWFAHTSTEHYMFKLMRFATRIGDSKPFKNLAVEPGNILLSRVASTKVFNHGGIVTAWPKIIHCMGGEGVAEVSATTHWAWSDKKVAIFDPFAKDVAQVEDLT